MIEANYITQEGWERLNQEVKDLWEERKIVTEAVSDAAAMGDRSENAEYIYGKKKLRELDKRIRFLHKRMDNLKVFVSELTASDTVIFSSYVEFMDERGMKMRMRIVGPDETNLKEQKMSVLSPIGKALLHKKVGEKVEVQTPAGRKVFEILSVTLKP